MFRGFTTNVIAANNVIFDSLALSQSIITNNMNMDISDIIFTKCSFTESDCRCIYHTTNNFHLERVLFRQITNSRSNVHLTSGYDKNISVVDYSDFSSSFGWDGYHFLDGGFLTMKRLNSSLSKGNSMFYYDNMIQLTEFSKMNIFNCSAQQYLLDLNSEPAGKTFYSKYASDVNIIKSNGEYAIFVSSEYTLERFCLMNNDVTYTFWIYPSEKTTVRLVDFWINNDFSTTGSGTIDKSGLETGQKELLILINLPKSNGKSCEEFQKWLNIISLSFVLIEHKFE